LQLDVVPEIAVTVAVADFVVSATLVAETVYDPARVGAVYDAVFPVPEIVPALACQLTLVFEAPETEAVNVCVPPAVMLVALGETVTVTPALVGPEVDRFEPLLPHAVSISAAVAAMTGKVR